MTRREFFLLTRKYNKMFTTINASLSGTLHLLHFLHLKALLLCLHCSLISARKLRGNFVGDGYGRAEREKQTLGDNPSTQLPK